jgi:hypothetical protein
VLISFEPRRNLTACGRLSFLKAAPFMLERQDVPLCVHCKIETELVTTVLSVGHDPGLRVYAYPSVASTKLLKSRHGL